MGLLAIDIETASPFEEPTGDNNTEHYEWLATAVAYRPDETATPETEVFFRRGGWGDEYTADMLERVVSWCAERQIDRTLTYNGAWFDLVHMGTWARDLEETGYDGAYDDLSGLFPEHVDLARAAADRYADELWDDQVVLSDWKAYRLAGIENESVWYDDYDFHDDYVAELGVEDDHVKGELVGRVLGERYVDGVTAGLEATRTHRELERLLRDYAESDVADLFSLYDALGGVELSEEYSFPLEAALE
ncbi:MAG: hypothetical protein ABEJ68_05250 [Halobacteriaceae archaeon]